MRTKIIVDEHTKERFMLAFDHNEILFAFEKIGSTPPSVSTRTTKTPPEIALHQSTENIPKGECHV